MEVKRSKQAEMEEYRRQVVTGKVKHSDSTYNYSNQIFSDHSLLSDPSEFTVLEPGTLSDIPFSKCIGQTSEHFVKKQIDTHG